MKTSILLIGFVASLALSAPVLADSMAAAEKAKSLCAGCHGPEGISINPLWPNIAGQQDQYMVKTMNDYKSGKRDDPNMAAIAQTLSDEEILELAAYYSALPAGG